jgi:UDP-GlcNAc:undecaprenyl-phosphate/decaprenyl-phosphate GlcNAc-1-phosphate transferase
VRQYPIGLLAFGLHQIEKIYPIMNGLAYFALASACALVAAIICLNAPKVGAYLNVMDIPKGRKQHRVATPLMGGVALLGAFVPVSIIQVVAFASERWFVTLLLWVGCIAVMALVGIADDRHSLSPKARLAISFAVFGFASIFDPTLNVRVLDFDFPKLSMGLGTWWLAAIFTVMRSIWQMAKMVWFLACRSDGLA